MCFKYETTTQNNVVSAANNVFRIPPSTFYDCQRKKLYLTLVPIVLFASASLSTPSFYLVIPDIIAP